MKDYGYSESHATRIAQSKGQEWLSENACILADIRMPYEIIRWDDWHCNFSKDIRKNKEFFYHALHHNFLFKKAIMEDVYKYYQRNGYQRLENIDATNLNFSLDYLIEELAVYSVIFSNYPSVRIYPGRELHCFNYVRNNEMQLVSQGIKNSSFIRLAIHGLDSRKIMESEKIAA